MNANMRRLFMPMTGLPRQMAFVALTVWLLLVGGLWANSPADGDFYTVEVVVSGEPSTQALELFYSDDPNTGKWSSVITEVAVSDKPKLALFRLPALVGPPLRLDPGPTGPMALRIHSLAIYGRDSTPLQVPLDRVAAGNNVLMSPAAGGGPVQLTVAAGAVDPQTVIGLEGLQLPNPTVGRSWSSLLKGALFLAAVLLAAMWAYHAAAQRAPAWDRHRAIHGLILFGIGMILLLMRNPDPVLHPVLYAEDGTWLAHIQAHGLFDALFNARRDYFVWGNVLLLYIADLASVSLARGDMVVLPYMVWLLSAAFYSGCAVATWAFLRSALARPDHSEASRNGVAGLAAMGFVALIMVPLGNSQNEVLGRLSNIGYGFFLIATLAQVAIVLRASESITIGWLLPATLVICGGTNPSTLPLSICCLALLLVVPVLRRSMNSEDRKMVLVVLCALVVLLVWVAVRTLQFGAEKSNFVFQWASLIEIAVARSLLYPFVGSHYVELTDGPTLALGVVLILIWLAGWLAAPARPRLALSMVILALVALNVVTLAMRPGLTDHIAGYRNTFPDRYFYVQNWMTVLSVILAMGCLVLRWPKASLIPALGLALLLGARASEVLEVKAPGFPIMTAGPFQSQVRDAWARCVIDTACASATGPVRVDIYSETWSMEVQRDRLRASLR